MTLAALALQHRLPMPQRLRLQRSALSRNAEAMPTARAGMRQSSSQDLCGRHGRSMARYSKHGCWAPSHLTILKNHATPRRSPNAVGPPRNSSVLSSPARDVGQSPDRRWYTRLKGAYLLKEWQFPDN